MSARFALTPNQELVWNELLDAGKPLGAYALLAQLQGDKLKAPLQIYRALNKLIELGMVHRLESINAFIACTNAHDHKLPHAFAICDRCGKVEEFTDPGIASQLAHWTDASGFKSSRIAVELHGICCDCRNAEAQQGHGQG